MVTMKRASVIGCGLVLATSTLSLAPSQAAVVDSPGILQQSYIYNPFFNNFDLYSGTWVEYQVDEAGTFPRVGDVFYVSTVVTALYGGQAPVMGVALDEKLEPDGGLAISAQNPVRCYLKTSLDDPTWDEVPESCSQQPTPTPGGGLTFGTRPLQYAQSFKVSVPVSFTKAKSGIADGPAARVFSVVSDINQTPDPLIAEQHIFVFPAAPTSNPGGDSGSDSGGTPGNNTGGTPAGLKVGQSTKLPGKQAFGKVRYTSKSPRVCKVTRKGKVTARKAGACKVLATAVKGKKRKTIKITVIR